MREVLRLGFVLLVVCAIGGAVLAFVDGITSDRIAAQAAIRLQKALEDVLPGAAEFQDAEELLQEVKAEASKEGRPGLTVIDKMYLGYFQDECTGLVFTCSPPGYGGPIETVVGVSLKGEISGVSVIRHAETPGLGSNITNPEFQMRFIGISKGTEVKVREDGGQIDAITGATISSRAIADAVNGALLMFEIVYDKEAPGNEL
ncbi:MAG: RnfABCDGE type electron transport complex subunit G [Firmicutes bacterium]|nr:RnfABCDGE type electron transport complex subunit G [Bacillota bacterium]